MDIGYGALFLLLLYCALNDELESLAHNFESLVEKDCFCFCLSIFMSDFVLVLLLTGLVPIPQWFFTSNYCSGHSAKQD